MKNVKEDNVYYKRRHIFREFNYIQFRKMFKLQVDELFLNAYYDKGNNKLVVESICDYDKVKGDIWK